MQAVVAAGYENVGTLEFLVDGEGRAYFIEINARIQVEHPVTEMLSGIDLVAEQIRIAAGEPLGYGQADVRLRGHAIEFRINAEDVRADFRPQVGIVRALRATRRRGRAHGDAPLQRLRGAAVLRFAPRQAHRLGSRSRDAPSRRSRVALEELVVDGLVTNIPFHRALLEDRTFLAGGFDTNLLDRRGAAAFLDAVAAGEQG